MVSYMILNRTILIVFQGTCIDRELVEAQYAMFDDPGFDPSFPRLVDATDCELRLTDTVIRHVAQAAYAKGMRRAALVSSSCNGCYGLMRMYSEYAGPDAQCEVFRDREEATIWLNGGFDVYHGK